jgi:hypothetical protein
MPPKRKKSKLEKMSDGELLQSIKRDMRELAGKTEKELPPKGKRRKKAAA